MKNVLQSRKEESEILTLIRETNSAFLDKTTYSILQLFPKLTNEIKETQKGMIEDSQNTFKSLISSNRGELESGQLEKLIHTQYDGMHTKIISTFQNVFSQDSLFYQNNMELKDFLEKQKNSTKKGKESENKLEGCLNAAFPNSLIIDKSGESKATDYMMKRDNKCDVLFENKDYRTNVPNEEIKKFIRDIEYQNKHGIMISQHSGIQNKENFQIDIHMNNILVFIHYGHYNEDKIKTAINIIDHLDSVLKKYQDTNQGTSISIEQMSGINKEYLQFIGQKKQLIETYKKQHKDHLKQLEDFEMPQLTTLLNSMFTNVDQLSFKCTICNNFNAKNKRALITHQNKCKKTIITLDDN